MRLQGCRGIGLNDGQQVCGIGEGGWSGQASLSSNGPALWIRVCISFVHLSTIERGDAEVGDWGVPV